MCVHVIKEKLLKLFTFDYMLNRGSHRRAFAHINEVDQISRSCGEDRSISAISLYLGVPSTCLCVASIGCSTNCTGIPP